MSRESERLNIRKKGLQKDHDNMRIGWIHKIRNKELYKKIQLKENLLQKIIQWKLKLFGHVCRMSGDRKIWNHRWLK